MLSVPRQSPNQVLLPKKFFQRNGTEDVPSGVDNERELVQLQAGNKGSAPVRVRGRRVRAIKSTPWWSHRSSGVNRRTKERNERKKEREKGRKRAGMNKNARMQEKNLRVKQSIEINNSLLYLLLDVHKHTGLTCWSKMSRHRQSRPLQDQDLTLNIFLPYHCPFVVAS